MNKWITRTAAATAAMIGLSMGLGTLASAAPAAVPAVSATSISAEVAAGISFMREEERLARDLYLAIAELYPDKARPFTRIARSEQRHFDRVGTLLVSYGLADPSAGGSPGSYAFDELTQLYQDLLAKAKGSLLDAYTVGIAVEQKDIADLEAVLADESLPQDVALVMTALKDGSESHLSAFKALSKGEKAAQKKAAKKAKDKKSKKGKGKK